MIKKTLIGGISYALFFLFVYASASKLMAFDYYLQDLKRSPLLRSYAVPLAIAVPVSELVVAVLLLPNGTRRYGLVGAVILMAFFTVYVVYVLGFTTERPCTCGGIIRELTWPQHLAFNISFLLLAVLGVCMQYDQRAGNFRKM